METLTNRRLTERETENLNTYEVIVTTKGIGWLVEDHTEIVRAPGAVRAAAWAALRYSQTEEPCEVISLAIVAQLD